MLWWSWIILGLALLVAEVAMPSGFFLCFFGLGALIVGVLVLLGLLAAETIQWALFSALSLLAILLFRKKLLQYLPRKHSGDDADSLVGDRGVAMDALAPAAVGMVELRGSTWNARNVGSTRIDSGGQIEVVAVDGLTLSVKSI